MKHWLDIFWNHLPDFLLAVVFLFVAWIIIGRLIKMIEFTMIHRTLNPTLSSFVKSFVSVALKTVVLITAAGIAGFEVTSLVTLMGAAGLAIGLSLQGELQNFAGGVMLLFFKPFEMGDYITVGQHTGKVEDIQIFNTKLRTSDSHQVILPNKMLSNEVITNYTKSDEVSLPIAFSEDLASFNWDNTQRKCGEVVDFLRQQSLILPNPFELRIIKSDGQLIYLSLMLKTKRDTVEEVKHQFWIGFHRFLARQ
jgi:small conductance mechanosensitive channel